MSTFTGKMTTVTIVGEALFLFFMLWGFQAAASDNDTIRKHIENRAAEQADISASQVKIYVEDGFVLLTGTVQLYRQKMDYEKIAWKTTNVTEVENEIEVKPDSPREDTAIEKEVQTILMDCKCFHGGRYIVRVVRGTVSVTGVFFYPRDVHTLKHQIAEIEGVVAIKIRATALIANGPVIPE